MGASDAQVVAWYETPRWYSLRAKTFVRDSYTCMRRGCGKVEMRSDRLMCVHILDHNGEERHFFDPGNVMTVCLECARSRR